MCCPLAHWSIELSDLIRNNFAGVLFSKDRAMQLCAAIESFYLHCSDSDQIGLFVLYKASDSRHACQYDRLRTHFPCVSFIEESDFRRQLLDMIARFDYVLFMVDDIMFVRRISLADVVRSLEDNAGAIGFSLRLGTNTVHCYSHNAPQILPSFDTVGNGVLGFDWTKAQYDFGYPLELSSSVYRVRDIHDLLGQIQFGNPNTLEASMAANVHLYAQARSRLLCFESSVAFCNPINMVQSTFSNRCGSDGRFTPERLAGMFDQGLRIDVEKNSGFVPDSCHQEVELIIKQGDDGSPTKLKVLESKAGCTEVLCDRSRPKFSIIMANYNNAGYIGQAIRSVISQTFDDWELIIVDDCSTDDSQVVISTFLSDSRIRLIRHQCNRGYTAALKTGIADIRSDYFGILDSDDCLAIEAVESMYDHHVRFPDCGLIYSQFVFCDEELMPRKKGFCAGLPDGKTCLDINVASSFKTFKLSDYLKTDGYDENILYAEDLDIIYRMEEVTKLRFVDECFYLYRELPSSVSHTKSKINVCIMSRVKARINALKRRSLASAQAGRGDFRRLFREAVEQARIDHQDVGQYFLLLRQMYERGFFESLQAPNDVLSGPVDDPLLWLAANVDIEFDKFFENASEGRNPDAERYDAVSERNSEVNNSDSIKSSEDITMLNTDESAVSAAQTVHDRVLVSVYMVTYNCERFIAQAIESVLGQTYRDIELLIVDDGSIDGTAKMIESFRDDRIRYIWQEHRNFASGMNRAICEAKGEFVMGVDSDDFIAPDYIERMLKCALQHPTVDYFYPQKLVPVDEYGKSFDQLWEYSDFSDNRSLPGFIFSNGFGPIPNPGSLKRRSLFERTGLYEEVETVEDFVFLCRHALDLRFHRVEEASVYFYRRLESGNSQKFQDRDRIMAAALNEMTSIYSAEVLCSQIAASADGASTTRQYVEFLANIFYRHAHSSKVKYGEYYRRYGDLYRYELMRLTQEAVTVGKVGQLSDTT